MAGKRKFLALCEGHMKRYERGGFLVGDVFKFDDDFKRSEAYKSLGNNTKELLDQMIDSGLHVRVTNIKDQYPAAYPANPDTSSYNVTLDIALDTGGGRYSHHCSIPAEFGQPVQYAPNLPPIPDVQRRPSRVTIKPEEIEAHDNIANKTDRGDGSLEDTELNLPQQNTDIPSDPVTPSPAVDSYTKEYLGDLVAGPSSV